MSPLREYRSTSLYAIYGCVFTMFSLAAAE